MATAVRLYDFLQEVATIREEAETELKYTDKGEGRKRGREGRGKKKKDEVKETRTAAETQC